MTREEKLSKILSGMTVRVDLKKFPGFIYFFKEDEFYFYLAFEFDGIFFSRKNLWSVFYYQWGMSTHEIRHLMREYLERHLNITTSIDSVYLSDLEVKDFKK